MARHVLFHIYVNIRFILGLNRVWVLLSLTTDRIGVERPVIESSRLRDLQLPPELMSVAKSLDL